VIISLRALLTCVSAEILPHDLKGRSLDRNFQRLGKQIAKILPYGAERARMKLNTIRKLNFDFAF
jgi:hypothetical protein